MTTPLDNQELDRKIVIAMGGNPQYRTTHNFDYIKEIIISEAHRIGNLAIGEDEFKGDTSRYSHPPMDYVRDRLRNEQRQKLSTLTGIKDD